MSPGQQLEPFAGKWLAHWPEQAVLEVFTPERLKPAARAWGGLLFELHECAFSLEHEPVRTQKSLWWSQELQAAELGSAKHPITRLLQEYALPFGGLAAPLLGLAQQAPIRAGSSSALAGLLHPFADAVACIEQGLFGGESASHPDSVSAQLLLMRLPHGLHAFDRALIPMNLLARHQSLEQVNDEQALLKDWLTELAGLLPAEQGGNWFRAAQTRFSQRRIRQLQSSKAPAISLGHVWDAWRAMRTKPQA
ncbi:MAG: hypothetical protein KAZ45_02830 [Arenimonas sp.]|nr:hypothetical protein [Arenimonas sp.]